MSEKWDFYFSRVNDKLASLFVDLGIRESAPDKSHPWLVWVWVYFQRPTEDGFCDRTEGEVFAEIEDALTASVEHAVEGRLVGRITSDGHREFYFYAPTFVGFDEAVAAGMQRFGGYQWDAGSNHDPEWDQYLNLLYPTPNDWQRIKNRHVIEQLEEMGDPLEKARPVYHWAYFAVESSSQQFAAAVRDLGYTVTDHRRLENKKDARIWGVKFERVDNADLNSINRITLELFQLAGSLGGDYDGWETSVEK